MSEHPPCVICGVAVAQNSPRENRKRWLARPTCGVVCGRKYRNRDADVAMVEAIREREPCLCGKAILPREGERRSRYLARRFCSRECAGVSMWEKRRGPRPPKPAAVAAQSVEDFLAAGGRITRVPAAYVAPSVQGSLPLAEELRRIKRIRPPPTPSYKGGNNWLFGPHAAPGRRWSRGSIRYDR